MSKPKYDWPKVKNEFILGQITQKGLSIKHNIPEQVLWNRAAKGKWQEERASHLKAKDAELAKQVQKAVIELDVGELMKEYKVRTDNFKAATDLLDTVMEQWEWNIEHKKDWLKDLKPRDFVCMVDTLLKIRKDSAGLPREFKMEVKTPVKNLKPGQLTHQESIEQQALFRELGEELLLYIEEEKAKEAAMSGATDLSHKN